MNRERNRLQSQESTLRGILLAYLVIFCHVVLILGLGLIMFLFGGIITYLPWILALGLGVMVWLWYLWWQHMKKRGRKLRDILKEPLLRGHSIDVTLLGGLASFRLGRSQEPLTVNHSAPEGPKQIVDPTTAHAEELTRLAHLLKQDLITIDEFLKAKKEIMNQ